MKCGFCGRQIPDSIPAEQERCGACPGGCRKVHCPYCGYANPAIPAFWRRRRQRRGRDNDSEE